MKKTSQPNWSLSSIKVMQNCQSCMYGSFQSTMVCTFHLCLWSIRTLYAISEIPKMWKYFHIKIYNVVQYKIQQKYFWSILTHVLIYVVPSIIRYMYIEFLHSALCLYKIGQIYPLNFLPKKKIIGVENRNKRKVCSLIPDD